MRVAGESVSRSALSGQQWLDSPSLPRIGHVAARRYRLGPDDCEDLLQELRLAVLRAGTATPLNTTWIFRAAEHRALDLVRARARTRAIRDEADAAPGSDPADRELLGLLRARASRLPREALAVYRLHLAGHSEREIASRLGTSRASVRRVTGWLMRFFGGRGGCARAAPGDARTSRDRRGVKNS